MDGNVWGVTPPIKGLFRRNGFLPISVIIRCILVAVIRITDNGFFPK